MPLIKEQIAKATAFQKNCALNCLVHAVVGNIEQIPETSLEALHKAFNRYYQTSLTFADFKYAIKIENPIHREIILGPILRKMLGDTNILGKTAEQNKQKSLDKPGRDLDDSDIVPLANFFGIYVESYSVSIYREQAFSALRSTSGFLKLKPAEREKLVLAKMRELRTENPNAQYETDRFESDAYTRTSVDRKMQIDAICSAYKEENVDDYPVLKLWNGSEAHFDYEEVGSTEAQTHNRVYRKDNRFQYGLNRATGIPNSDGAPDAEFVRERIGQGIRTGKLKSGTDLSRILTEYEEECVKQQSAKEQQGNPFSSLFGGSIPGKIFQAFTGPFTNASGGESDFGFKPTSNGIMGIFEGIMHLGLKIFEMMQGLASVAPDIAQAFESAQQGSANPFDFGSTSPQPSGSDPSDPDNSNPTDWARRFTEAQGAYDDRFRKKDSDSSSGSSSSGPFFTPQHQNAQQRTKTQNREIGPQEISSTGQKMTYRNGMTIEVVD